MDRDYIRLVVYYLYTYVFVADPNKHDILFDRSGAGKLKSNSSRFFCSPPLSNQWVFADKVKLSAPISGVKRPYPVRSISRSANTDIHRFGCKWNHYIRIAAWDYPTTLFTILHTTDPCSLISSCVFSGAYCPLDSTHDIPTYRLVAVSILFVPRGYLNGPMGGTVRVSTGYRNMQPSTPFLPLQILRHPRINV